MFKGIKGFLNTLGPGLITGASDDDPSGIATYAQTGAKFGYGPLWLCIFTLPLMITVQEMCARIGIVTKKGLILNLKPLIPAPVLWILVLLLAIANGVNAGANIGMMAASARLVLPQLSSVTWMILLTALTLGLQIFLSYKTYARYLKWLTLTLFSYILIALIVKVDWSAAAQATLIPNVQNSREFLLLIIAFLGTTISPYLYFWQANLESEEARLLKRGDLPLKERVRLGFWDVLSGMTLSNIVAWFVILTGAAVLFVNGIYSIETADQAASMLAPLAGRFASLLFATATIAIGLLAVPVLTSVIGYAVCEALGRADGLSKTWREAKLFYGVVVVLTILGTLINLTGIGPIRLLILSAVGNALIAPPLLAAIIWFGNTPQMRQYKNGHVSNALGVFTFVIMTLASVMGIYLMFN